MRKTFELFVLDICLATAQINDLELLECIMENKVEPVSFDLIRTCLQNIYDIPIKSRFWSCKPIFILPTIHAWGFILKMLHQRQLLGGEVANRDKFYVRTMFSMEVIRELSVSNYQEYHVLLMKLNVFSNLRYIWFNKYPIVYGKYFKEVIENTHSFNDTDVMCTVSNVSHQSHTNCDVLQSAILLANKIRVDSSHIQWYCLSKLLKICGDKYWDTVQCTLVETAQENLSDICCICIDMIIKDGGISSSLNLTLKNASQILSIISMNKK